MKRVKSIVKFHRIAIYCRVSSARQEGTGYGLDAQFDRCIAYCVLRNLNIELTDLYVDGGISGSTVDRKEYQEMMTAIANGFYDYMIIAKLDRVSRNIVDFTELLDFLSEHDVTLVSIDDNLDVNNLTGRMISQIRMIFAELEQKLAIERTNDSIIARIKSSKYPHGRAPFGFNKDSSMHLSINEKEAAILKDMVNVLYETRSLRNVYASCLVKYPEYKWSIEQIKKTLKSRVYTGGMEFKNVFYPNQFPVLISQKEHEKIVSIIESKSKDRKYLYMYKDVVYCKKCGEKLRCTVGTSCTGKKYLYYQCKSCRKSISDETLNILFQPYIYKIVESAPIGNSEEIRELNSAIDEINKKEKELFELYMNNKIDSENFVDISNKIKKRKNLFISDLKKHKNANDDEKVKIYEKSGLTTQFVLLHKTVQKIYIDFSEKKIVGIVFFDESKNFMIE